MDRLDITRCTSGMTTNLTAVGIAVTALSSAVVGGIFYAFSTFVMRGLDRTDPADAITAMRGINAEAQANAPFLVLFVGSALLSIAVGALAAVRISQPGSGYLLAGAIFGVVAMVVTVAFNVPLNDRLAAVDPAGLSAADAALQWQAYLSPWTAWNHVRAASGVIAAGLLLAGLHYR